jgi:hypothetical protein
MQILFPLVIVSIVAAPSSARAADWVNLIPRDPFVWVDLDSKRTGNAGLTHVQMSLSGNPSSRRNAGTQIKFVSKALDCKVENAVFDVDESGAVKSPQPLTDLEKLLTPARDKELDNALFKRVCLGKRFSD